MSGTHQPEQPTDNGGLTDNDGPHVAAGSVALVPTAEPLERASKPVHIARPDPNFLTHLIATAEQVPQTRNHRRAAQADAMSAYRAHQPHAPEAGFRTRQVI